MRILHVIRSTDAASGGPIESLIQHSEVLLRHGDDIHVVSLEQPDDSASRSFPLPLTQLGKGLGRYGFNPKLQAWMRENAERFDVVILHGIWNYSSVGTWLGLRGQKTPYLIYPHGMMDPWFRRNYPLKNALKQIYWLLAEGRVLRDAHMVLFSCQEEMRRARGAFWGFRYRGTVIHYGTSSRAIGNRSKPDSILSKLPSIKDRQFLLFIGRIHPIKGCDVLLKAFSKSLDTIPDNIDLVIAGPDQVGWQRDLQKLAATLGVDARVHWPGMLQGDEKWDALRSAIALVLPSHQESFGMVIAEAMSVGTPVVISDKVNTWHEVKASGCGLIGPDTPDGIATLLRQMCNLSVLERQKLSESARQGFLKYFDISQVASDIDLVMNGSKLTRNRHPGPLNILHVIRSTEAATGGPIEWLYRLSEATARAGHSIEIVSLDSAEHGDRAMPFPVTRLGRGTGKYGFNRSLARWLKANAHRFDIAVIHGLWNYSSFGTWRGLHESDVPYVIFPHGMMDPWFRDQYPLKHLKKLIYWKLFEGKVLRDARRVIFTCEEEKLRACGVFGAPAYREEVVRLGTADPSEDIEFQKSSFYQAFPQLRGRRFLLFLSRIHPKKGCDILLQAFAACVDRIPSDIDLLIAGPDSQHLVPRLRELARRHRIEARVHWSPMLDGDIKWGAFRCAEAFVFPSHQENFGFVVAESMACGTPVLMSDKVNIWREVIESGGGLIDSDDVRGTESLITRYFSLSDQERAHMRTAARAGYLRYFKIERAANDLMSLLYQIVNEDKSKKINLLQTPLSA